MTFGGGQSDVFAHSCNYVCCVLSGMQAAGPTVPPPTAPKLHQEAAWHRTCNRDPLPFISLLAVAVEWIGLAVANTRMGHLCLPESCLYVCLHLADICHWLYIPVQYLMVCV